MMKLSKLLDVAVVALATLNNGYSTDIILEFRSNNNYFVQCGDNVLLWMVFCEPKF